MWERGCFNPLLSKLNASPFPFNYPTSRSNRMVWWMSMQFLVRKYRHEFICSNLANLGKLPDISKFQFPDLSIKKRPIFPARKAVLIMYVILPTMCIVFFFFLNINHVPCPLLFLFFFLTTPGYLPTPRLLKCWETKYFFSALASKYLNISKSLWSKC